MWTFLQNLIAQAAPAPRQRFRRGSRPRRKTWVSHNANSSPHSHFSRPNHPYKAFRRGSPPNGKSKSGKWFFARTGSDGARGSSQRRGEIVAWHGTPGLQNVKSILAHGWVVGNGNAFGDGVYASSDFNVAKGYAGSSGYVLKLAIKAGRVATWSVSFQTAFTSWCTRQQCAADMSAKTAFLLGQGFHTLREGNVIVVLLRAYRNPLAAKIRTWRVRVLSAVATADGKNLDLHSLMKS